MSRAVYKYPLYHGITAGRIEIELPKDAQILSVQEQFGALELWALVELDDTQETETRRFVVIPTGARVDESRPWSRLGRHVSTVLLNQGSFVVHVFEVTL